VLSCKIAEQSLLIQKLFYSRLEEEDFYSIIVLVVFAKSQIIKLILYSFVSQFEARKIHSTIQTFIHQLSYGY